MVNGVIKPSAGFSIAAIFACYRIIYAGLYVLLEDAVRQSTSGKLYLNVLKDIRGDHHVDGVTHAAGLFPEIHLSVENSDTRTILSGGAEMCNRNGLITCHILKIGDPILHITFFYMKEHKSV